LHSAGQSDCFIVKVYLAFLNNLFGDCSDFGWRECIGERHNEGVCGVAVSNDVRQEEKQGCAVVDLGGVGKNNEVQSQIGKRSTQLYLHTDSIRNSIRPPYST